MAIAKQPGGLYFTDKGVAVDAAGVVIEDAPKQAKDTPPSQQPGAHGPATPEDRLVQALARAGVVHGATAKDEKDKDSKGKDR